jgi:hypothetical protein
VCFRLRQRRRLAYGVAVRTLYVIWIVLFSVAIGFLLTSGCRTFHMEGTIDATEPTTPAILP